MATFVSLLQFSEKGIQDIQASPERAAAFRSAVESAGGKVRELLWTLGRCDVLLVFDAADDEAATALMLSLGRQGRVRTETFRAFGEDEFKSILKKV